MSSATPRAAEHWGRGPWVWAIVGATAGALLVLLMLAPARWLAAMLAQASDGMVNLAETDGTVWTGSGVLAFTGGSGSRDRTRLPGRVHWTLRPALLGLAAKIDADCCTPEAPLALRTRLRWMGADVDIADSHSSWPATVLTGLGTPWNTIRPRGQLTLDTQALALTLRPRSMAMTGRAELTAHDMSSNLSTVRPLGSYVLELTGGETLTFALSTLAGSLQLSGAGSMVAGNLRFRGQAEAEDGMEAQLSNLLNLIGSRRGKQAIISFG